MLRQPLLALLPLLLLLQPLEERDSRVSEAPPMPIHFNPSGLNGFFIICKCLPSAPHSQGVSIRLAHRNVLG